jgi:hypothetical protein
MSFWRNSPNLNVGDMIDGYRIVAVKRMVSPSIAITNQVNDSTLADRGGEPGAVRPARGDRSGR